MLNTFSKYYEISQRFVNSSILGTLRYIVTMQVIAANIVTVVG